MITNAALECEDISDQFEICTEPDDDPLASPQPCPASAIDVDRDPLTNGMIGDPANLNDFGATVELANGRNQTSPDFQGVGAYATPGGMPAADWTTGWAAYPAN